jgi:hypothetical protein
MPDHKAPLIVVASPTAGVADEIARRLQLDGAIAYATHSVGGCLRVATSLGPDIVLVDPVLPGRLRRLLRAHPTSARAQVLKLTESGIAATRRALASRRAPTAAA